MKCRNRICQDAIYWRSWDFTINLLVTIRRKTVHKILKVRVFNSGILEVLVSIMICGCSFTIFSLGLIGEYTARILDKVTVRECVVEKERLNFDEETNI
mgnify:CR=1 FL=1